ncbi:LysE family translocator [Maritalea porphyrae]|uniref:LysE family translocator n=1 Tax=Maritalea porphyrae TaxID=880732 RepID=UPI0022B00FBC|nr:LysE family translocator [Maritalea porphyrae]MCZ4273594.1 LysE family translocator [Maritalea porphyrae]
MDIIIAHLPNLALAYFVFFLAVASPGPATLAIAGASMSLGRPQGIAKAAGIVSGSFLWGMFAVFGMVAFISSFAGVLFWLKIAGGVYLLWMAYKAAKNAASTKDPQQGDVGGRSLWKQYWGGFVLHTTNPKALFAWAAVITLGLQPNAPWWMSFVVFAGAYCVSLFINFSYALFFSTDRMIKGYFKVRRWVQGIFGVVFAAAGLKLIIQG